MTSHLEQIMALKDYVYAGLAVYVRLYDDYDDDPAVESFDRLLMEQVFMANAEHVLTALFYMIENDD